MARLYLSSAIAGAVLFGSAASAVAQTTLVFDRWLPPTHPLVVGIMEPFKADVEQVTEGRVQIQISDSPLAPSGEQWEAVQDGISDVAIQSLGWHRGRINLPTIVNLPFMVPSAEEASGAMWRTYVELFDDAGEFEGMQVLGFVSHSGNQVANGTRAIESAADFEGLRLRASAGEPTQILETLGATPVTAPGPQIFELVSASIVDGILDGMHAPSAFGIIRYVDHVTEIPGSLGGLAFAVFMNGERWNEISEEDQAAIMEVAGESLSRRGGREFDSFTAKSLSEMEAEGARIAPAGPEFVAELEEKLQPIIDGWVEQAADRNVDGEAAIDFYRSQLSQ
jgi:TRAP-type C4-dicarboxylate transport system substrate-binding protein